MTRLIHLATVAAGVAAGGALALAAAAPALAEEGSTTADLRQSDVTADDPEFDQRAGQCVEKPDQDANEDIWVFVWPGNQVDELVSLTLSFDRDQDGVADTTRTEADATETLDQGTLKMWVTTPAGWTLVDGTSEVTGTVRGSKFNLTHSCAGQPGDGNGKPTPSPTQSARGEDGDNGGGTGGGDDEGGLPVTGIQVGGAILLGLGLVGAGGSLLLVGRRWRTRSDPAGS